MSHSTSTPDKRVEVAVGILLQGTPGQEQFLLGTRPAGKPYAGYWEFPGGKIEAGESVEAALCREFDEELGICIDPAAVEIWRTTEHDYEHARVRLHWCKVRAWQGDFQMREGQQVAWQGLPPTVSPILPGAYPVLDALAAERAHAME
ncbi:NUDIX domain-containing protein [Corticibacter populi]|uniref:8-oxo-dGTP diphosphatase n=1 Tax=Corticibacter populi TaxID=1550736 RepID=A0A3M6QJ08_9BURK|nr:NUDIX domain-containing protein [Corticibacter populi]RMX02965.1 NUDIX domain-containing protein [Corticibacter populi]RZS33388.1 8-oxo-dGTPase [Corticibacter populi]